MSAWTSGVPWTFYYVFIAVKTSMATLVLFLIGLPLAFRRRLGDGRILIFFWAFVWFMPFTFLGGKFTRYFTLVEPIILIIAAIGFYFSVKWISGKLFAGGRTAAVFQAVLFAIFIAAPLVNSISVAPHYRLFTNTIGGGNEAAGLYFPHDEFYDTSTRDITTEIARVARPGAVIVSETPGLFEYYAKKMRRVDLVFVSLSDPTAIDRLSPGDIIVAAQGRRYRSNTAYLNYLERSATPVSKVKIREVIAGRLYMMNEDLLAGLRSAGEKEWRRRGEEGTEASDGGRR
jgi:hypothetical protein